ncbi:MAG: transcriptional repressor LexA [Spirochaetia bacterium]|nr:transcriptional repressor LexA [Spirochaetia bacterium]
MKKLTERQTQVLDFIKKYKILHSYAPSTRDVADHFSMSVRGAYDHIIALRKKGFITADSHRSRSIGITNDNMSIVRVPVLGNVAAGLPLLAEQNLDGYVAIPENVLGHGTHFALKVKGDSMKDAGILDGDTAILVQQETAENGSIVVALLNNESITLKRFFNEQNRVRLQAENPIYPPIYTSNVRVVGKLVYLVRSYA